MRPILACFLAFFVVAPGCFGAREPAAPVLSQDDRFRLPVEVHVVLVGFEAFDEAAFLAELPQATDQFNMLRAYVTTRVDWEPLQYDVTYRIHRAPSAFAQALFDHARTLVTPQPAGWYLQEYDLQGEQRACAPSPVPPVGTPETGYLRPVPPTCEAVDAIDAHKLEAWIEANRDAHGLRFSGAGFTYFVLDSYTNAWLPKDRYHVYASDDGSASPYVKNLRMWGGNHDFVFHDVGAAPSDYDVWPWANLSRQGSDDALWNGEDAPIWNYTAAKGNQAQFYANLARNVHDAVRMLWARKPIYAFEYSERYHLPMYVVVDPQAHSNPDSVLSKYDLADVRAHTRASVIERAFQELAPWAEVTLDLKFLYLPEDDPAMHEAVRDAKSRGGDYVDFGVVKKYVRENWNKYVPSVPGARTYPTFAFWLDAPTGGGTYAYSDFDEFGNSWGVFVNAPDLALCLPPRTPACFIEDQFEDETSWWAWWNAVLVHELGHSFGLTHPHDTAGLDGHAFTTYEVNWLLDSTSSVMTYRHSIPEFNRFDKDLLLRAHAAGLSLKVLATSEVTRAREEATKSLDELRAGRWATAFERAREATRSASLDLAPAPLVGRAGTPQTVTVRLPGGVPGTTLACTPLVGCTGDLATKDVNYAVGGVDIPADANAVLFEFRERTAATHAGWSAYVEVIERRSGTVLTGLYNNGLDRVALLDVARCAGGCDWKLVVSTGSDVSYDLTITPYFAS